MSAYPAPSYPVYAQSQPTTVVVTAGSNRFPPGACAFCGGVMRDRFTTLGIVVAVCFFPLGILCCLLMTERRCSSCGR